MKGLITSKEMGAIDRNSEYLGIDTTLLMENAGAAVARIVLQYKRDDRPLNVVIFAGIGNNGGDGLVAARHLAGAGANVTLIIVGDTSKIRTKPARANLDIVKRLSYSIKTINITDSSQFGNIRDNWFAETDVVVDALLGTGLVGDVREPVGTAIDLINSLECIKIAVDTPSGLDSDTGHVHGRCVHSDVTVVFHKPRKGLIEAVKEGKFVKELVVEKIGIPPETELIVGEGDLLRYTFRRPRWAKKGDYGRILVIGGSNEFSGAPALAGMAALRTGVDWVTLLVPSVIASVERSFSPNLIVHSLEGKCISARHLSIIKGHLTTHNCVIVGPGISRNEDTLSFVPLLLETIIESNTPLIIDADALKADILPVCRGANVILTPHRGEFRILFKVHLTKDLGIMGLAELVQTEAARNQLVIVLKGNKDIIADETKFRINETGNPGMTVGGTGDVLSGIIAGLVAQNVPPFDAASIGCFICGLAGQEAFIKYGYSLLATDVIDHIHTVMEKAYA